MNSPWKGNLIIFEIAMVLTYSNNWIKIRFFDALGS